MTGCRAPEECCALARIDCATVSGMTGCRAPEEGPLRERLSGSVTLRQPASACNPMLRRL